MTVRRFNVDVQDDAPPCSLYEFECENGYYVSYDDYAELQCKVEALVVDNEALKNSVDHAAGCISAAEAEGLIEALSEKDADLLADLIHRRLCHAYLPVETQATDAALAEIRAQGVEMYADYSNRGGMFSPLDYANELRKESGQ